MAFLDDFDTAMKGYPAASIALEIVDRAAVAPPLPNASVNINEVWRFQVRIRNNGLLNMTSVSLRIMGLNGAQVSTTATGGWVNTITSFGNLTVNAHGGQQDTVDLFFKAPNATRPAGTELVCVQIAGFDANLNHLLNDHTGASDQPRVCYRDQVFPS